MCATRFIVYMFSIGSLILNRLPAFGMISLLLCLGRSLTKMGKEKRGEQGRGKVEGGGVEETPLKGRQRKWWRGFGAYFHPIDKTR